MEDEFRTTSCHKFDHCGSGDVQMVDGQCPAGAPSGIGQIGEGAGGEVVDDIDLMALDQQPIHQGGPDEPCSAGD